MDGGTITHETIIRPATVAEIMDAPEFPALVAEYAAESKIPGMPPPGIVLETYRRLEHLGSVHAFGAFHMKQLVGFISVLVTPPLHYDDSIATIGSWFVTRSARGSGAGWKLLVLAEDAAHAHGAPGLAGSVPKDSPLGEFLERAGYVATSTVYYKRDL